MNLLKTLCSIHGFALAFFVIADFVPSFAQQCLPHPSFTTFEQLIQCNSYVDKTKFVGHLAQDLIKQNKYFLLTRAPRFGKSTFIDTLEAFYSNKRLLFNNTYIYDHLPETCWNKHPIFRLDFSVIDFVNRDVFRSKFTKALQRIAANYELEIDDDDSIGYLTTTILVLLKKKFGLGVVVLIDEYDAPYIAHNPGSDNARSILLELKTFYLSLKIGSPSIHFCFITGVTRVPLTDTGSGLDYDDITFMEEFGAIVGFTKNEVKQYFQQHIDNVARIKKNTSQEIEQEIKRYFDGYKFTCHGEPTYNPCSIIRYFHSGGENKGLLVTTGESSFLRNKLTAFPIDALEMIIQLHRNDISNPKASTEPVLQLSHASLGTYWDLKKQTFETLKVILMFHGYLSIDSCLEHDNDVMYSLKFPNYQVQSKYMEQIHFLIPLTDKEDSRLRKAVKAATKYLASHEWAKFINEVNLAIAQMPYTVLSYHTVAAKEKWFQIRYQLIMVFGGFNSVTMEEMTSLGRTDVVMENNDGIYITELKLKSNKIGNAIDQCSTKYAPKFLECEKEITCIAVVISDHERKIVEWGVHRYSENGDFLQQHGQIKGTHTEKIHSFVPKIHEG